MAVSFLLGSIPFAVIAMAGSGIDIRKVGSGNPGFNNVLRVSKGRAAVALAGDLGKGWLALWLVLRVWPLPAGGAAWPCRDPVALGWLFGFAAVLGHCFSPWLKFRGGKGVATSAGVMLVLYPLWAVLALAYFVLVRIAGSRQRWREAGAVASLSTWALFTFLVLVFAGYRDAFYAAAMTIFLTYRHSSNLRRLLSGPTACASEAPAAAKPRQPA